MLFLVLFGAFVLSYIMCLCQCYQAERQGPWASCVHTFQESAAKAKKFGCELKAGGPSIHIFWSSYTQQQDDKKFVPGAEGTKDYRCCIVSSACINTTELPVLSWCRHPSSVHLSIKSCFSKTAASEQDHSLWEATYPPCLQRHF